MKTVLLLAGGPPTAATEIPPQSGHGGMLLVLLVVLAVWGLSRGGRSGGRAQVHRAHRAHGGGHDPVSHEALGHAAVGYGVHGHGRGIRARVNKDGSGWCEVPRRRMTVAESLAITLGGELAAGPSGCGADRKRYQRDLRAVPRRQRAQVDAEARAIAARHVGNAFGRKVARRLERTGRFR